jgi:hypothetical protein
LRKPGPLTVVLSFSLPLILTGCTLNPTASPIASKGASIQGKVHGGQSPIVGAHVYLFAANATGYAGPGIAASTSNPSLSLLNVASTGLSDTIGAYVTSDATGSFSITGDYLCTAGQQVYLYALGGNTGAGVNSAAGLLAVLGNCPASGSFLPALPLVQVNEATTVAAAYAFAGFATDATHVSSSGTALAQIGIANAFANAANLTSIVSGGALATTAAGNGTVPQAEINTLANILAACVNATDTSPAACTTLFSNAASSGTTGTVPTDTATAAINLAHNPGSGIASLFALQVAAGNPFQPSLSAAPNDFTIALNFTGGGLSSPDSIAIDSLGNAWAANYCGGLSPSCAGLSELNSLGAAQSPAAGYVAGGLEGPQDVAIDTSGNVWVPNFGGGLSKVNGTTGAGISGSGGYTGGGLSGPYASAIDASGNVWTINSPGYPPPTPNLAKHNGSTGAAISGSNGYTGGGLNKTAGIAVDAAGFVWIANSGNNSVSKFNVSNGVAVSSSAGYTGAGINDAGSIAVDHSGNVWVASYARVAKLNGSTGAAITTSSGYSGGGVTSATGIAIDGAGGVWVSNSGNNSLSNLNSTGTAISPSTGYVGGSMNYPIQIAIDGSGNAWVPNFNASSVTEFIGIAIPVVTPIAAGVANNTLGTRP